jgi:serine/threonine-protein kinase RsbW/sigma-B regulation protein RsbU (phosphoserine phosphatase)
VGTLRLALAADVAEVARLADAAGKFAVDSGLEPDAVARLLTALDEIVTNIVTHGGLNHGATIDVSISDGATGLDVAVEDPGPPFDPLVGRHSPMLDAGVDQRPIGGLGIYLVQHLTRDLAYSRTPDGNNRLSFHIE